MVLIYVHTFWYSSLLSFTWAEYNDSHLVNRIREGKNGNFTAETPGRRHSNQAIKASMASGKSWEQGPLTRCDKHTITSAILPQNSLITRKHQTSANWGTFYKIPKQYFSKGPRSRKTRKAWETVTDWKRYEAICMWYPGLNPRNKKNTSWKIGDIRKKVCNLVNGIVPVLFSPFW